MYTLDTAYGAWVTPDNIIIPVVHCFKHVEVGSAILKLLGDPNSDNWTYRKLFFAGWARIVYIYENGKQTGYCLNHAPEYSGKTIMEWAELAEREDHYTVNMEEFESDKMFFDIREFDTTTLKPYIELLND